MLCACSGERFRLEEPPESPESLATRDFSASGLSSRTGANGDWDSKLEEIQVDEAESTLKEALSLNYEEARALLGRLEYQRRNFDAALQVFQGIDIRGLTPRMTKAIVERTRSSKPRSRVYVAPSSAMSMHSVSLLLEAIFLKARSLEELGCYREGAIECKVIMDVVESALPKGMPKGISEVCKLQDVFHKALELLPRLWTKAGNLDETVASYRRALVKPWNLDPQKVAATQKALASVLLYGGVEASSMDNTKEAILLLLLLVKKATVREIEWDPDLMDHLSYALSVIGQFELIANYVEQTLPGVYTRGERWFYLSLCYSAAGNKEAAISLLKKASGPSEAPHVPSLLLGAKLCSEDPKHSRDGINFARKLLDLVNNQSEHLSGQAHRFLGVCYGNAARTSVSDSERALFQKKSLLSLNSAAKSVKDDPEVILALSFENAVQRNLNMAFDGAVEYSSTMAGVSARAWKHLALVLSADRRFKDSENVLEFAMEEADEIEQLELLKLKAVLQMAQEQPKQAIRTYSTMLALIRAQAQPERKEFNRSEDLRGGNFEMEVWEDLASIYGKLGSWSDAEACLGKAKSIALYSPRVWHATGLSLEARSLHEEALVPFFLSLSIEPGLVPSMVSIAEVMIKLGGESLPIARSFLLNALQLDPTNHDVWMNLGLIAKTQGLSQQAADFYQAAYELKSSAPVQSFI